MPHDLCSHLANIVIVAASRASLFSCSCSSQNQARFSVSTKSLAPIDHQAVWPTMPMSGKTQKTRIEDRLEEAAAH